MINEVQQFKETITELVNFFSLESDDELADIITMLLKYSAKHKEFVKNTLEKKQAKERSITMKFKT